MEGLVFSATTKDSHLPPPNPPDTGGGPVHPNQPPCSSSIARSSGQASFRGTLLSGSQEVPPRKEKVDWVVYEGGNKLLPKVFLDKKVFQELCSPWKDALVIKLLGKVIGYNTMKDRLTRIWKLQGGFDIMDIDNSFYMVKFDLAEDREKVSSGGPWMIFDHYLAVTHWTPEFVSPAAKIERTLVWICFPGLNLVYYDESFLLAMASTVGKPIRMDTNTLKVERGRFARICVEIDLTQPVVGKVWLYDHWYNVTYEGLHIICTSCGRYGHYARSYKHSQPQQGSTPVPAA